MRPAGLKPASSSTPTRTPRAGTMPTHLSCCSPNHVVPKSSFRSTIPRVSLAQTTERQTAVYSLRRTSGSRAAWLAVLFTLLAAGLRLYRLGHKSIWWDEGFSVFLARLPLGEMLTATAHDTHPPVYYAVLSLWRLAAGDAEVAV